MANEIDARFRQVKLCTDPLRVIVSYMIGKLFGLDLAGAFESNRAFDSVFELADIPVPGVIFKNVDRLWRDRQCLAGLIAEFLDKVSDQVANVLGSFPQRR